MLANPTGVIPVLPPGLGLPRLARGALGHPVPCGTHDSSANGSSAGAASQAGGQRDCSVARMAQVPCVGVCKVVVVVSLHGAWHG